MKVHIISDMEGVAGIVKWEQMSGGNRCTRRGAAVQGGDQRRRPRREGGGATEIVVMDCHGAGGGDWSFNSLLPERLDVGCEFVVQREWTEYTDFLEQGCDAALFVGMHAQAPGRLDGLLSSRVSGSQGWTNLSFNGASPLARGASTRRSAALELPGAARHR